MLTNWLKSSFLIIAWCLQFPSTKRWITVSSTTGYHSMWEVCIIGSNIHHVPASQANYYNFGAGVNIIYCIAIYYHVVEGSRVDNDLCVDVWMNLRKKSPRELVHSINWGCEHSRIAVVGGSKVCFDDIEQQNMMQIWAVFWTCHVRTECHVSGGTWQNVKTLVIVYFILSKIYECWLIAYCCWFCLRIFYSKDRNIRLHILGQCSLMVFEQGVFSSCYAFYIQSHPKDRCLRQIKVTGDLF